MAAQPFRPQQRTHYDNAGNEYDNDQQPPLHGSSQTNGISRGAQGTLDDSDSLLGAESAAVDDGSSYGKNSGINPPFNGSRNGGEKSDSAASLTNKERVAPDQVGAGYTNDGLQKKKGKINNALNRKRAGIVGLITGLTFGGGALLITPNLSLLNAMQYGGLIGKFSGLSDNVHSTHLGNIYRYMRSNGDIGTTRLSYLEYKMYPKMLASMKSNGITLKTDRATGQINGLVMEQKALPDEYKNLSEEQLQKKLMEDNGVKKANVKISSDGTVEVSGLTADKMSVRRNILKLSVKQSGASKAGGAFKLWVLQDYFAAHSNLFHPFQATKEAAQNKFSTTIGGSELYDKLEKSRLSELVKSTSEARVRLADATNSKVGRAAGAALLVTGVLCAIYNGIEDAAQASRDTVVDPGVTTAIDAQAVPAQAQANSPDITSAEIDAYDKNLNTKDANGGTAFDAPAAVAEGSGGTTPQIAQGSDVELNLASLNTAFAYVGDISNAQKTLDQQYGAGALCSAAGMIIQGAIGVVSLFTPGGWILKGITSAAFGVGLYMFQNMITSWASTGSISITPHVGTAGGQLDMFGGREAANIIERPSGFPLTTTQETGVRTAYNADQAKEFASKSLIARVFDPTDTRTIAGKLVQQNTGSASGNIAKGLSGLTTNIASLFRLPAILINSTAHGAPGAYDYPFPLVSTPSNILYDPSLSNPNVIDSKAAQILSGADGASYISKADDCGITITHNAFWDFTTHTVTPNSPKYQTVGCDDASDPNWVLLKTWVGYTQDMGAEACRLGDDSSCDWVSQTGNSSTATAAASYTTGSSTIDTASLFKDSTSISCDPNTGDLGVHDGYTGGTLVKIRLCAVPTLVSSGGESNDGWGIIGAKGQAVVNSRLSGAYYNLGLAAKKPKSQGGLGSTLTLESSYRSMSHQQSLYSSLGAGLAAQPGYSNHQMGLAIDTTHSYSAGTSDICTQRSRHPEDAIWTWMNKYATDYGLYQYAKEGWHWDALNDNGITRCASDGTKP